MSFKFYSAVAMKTGFSNFTQFGKGICKRKSFSQSESTITNVEPATNTWLAGHRKPLGQLFGIKPTRAALTLSALYFCVACTAEGLEDGSQRFGITVEQLPSTDEEAASTDESIPTANLDANPFAAAEVTVQPSLAGGVGAEVVVVAVAEEEPDSSVASSPDLGAANSAEIEEPEVTAPEAAVTATPQVVEPSNIPVFRAINDPLISGSNVVSVDYPDANTMWQIDFWVGGEIVNEQNSGGVDQGPSVTQSAGNESYTVNIPSGVTEIKLYVRYWVEGTPFPTTWVAGENFIETTVSVEARQPQPHL